jgi:hypothetical protein
LSTCAKATPFGEGVGDELDLPDQVVEHEVRRDPEAGRVGVIGRLGAIEDRWD